MLFSSITAFQRYAYHSPVIGLHLLVMMNVWIKRWSGKGPLHSKAKSDIEFAIIYHTEMQSYIHTLETDQVHNLKEVKFWNSIIMDCWRHNNIMKFVQIIWMLLLFLKDINYRTN